MRVKYSESFPEAVTDGEATLSLIRKIVEERLAEEILRRMEPARPGDQIA